MYLMKKQPAVERIVEFIQKAIARGSWPVGQRIPTISWICAATNTANKSVIKAVRLLINRGLITPKKYVNSPNTGSMLESVPLQTLKWQKLRTSLEGEIALGRFSAGSSLPAISQLKEQYGVHYKTLKKALDALTADALLMPYKKNYRVTPFTKQTRSGFAASIVAFGQGDASGIMTFGNQSQTFIRAIERECVLRNVHPEILGFQEKNGSPRFTSTPKIPVSMNELLKHSSAMGFMIWFGGEPPPLGFMTDFLETLCRADKPIAVLHDSADHRIVSLFSRNRLVRFFSLATRACGYTAGKFLQQLGHKNVAYISDRQKASWSQERLAGLREAYASAGQQEAVHAFTSDTFSNDFEMTEAAKQQGPAQWRSLLLPFKAGLDALQKKIPVAGFTEWEVRTLKSVLYEQEARSLSMQNVHPLLKAAHADEAPTAWVCANDGLAWHALMYLQEKKISVPRQISIMGFDDALDLTLTSYNFNRAECVRRMIDYVLYPALQDRFKAARLTEIDGYIVERRSTAKAAR
jgi:DNA-binding LacI/PurR family transcriptional regulator/DNA-binding FadR family transcriptional regulator